MRILGFVRSLAFAKMIRDNRRNEIPFFGQSFRSNLFLAFVNSRSFLSSYSRLSSFPFFHANRFFFFLSFFVQLSTTKEDQEEIARKDAEDKGTQ